MALGSLSVDVDLVRRPAELLQRLLRFDTSNPPGGEGACLAFVGELLAAAGVEARLLGATAERPNLVARLAGRGAAPPLLLQAHVDVVPADRREWTHDPFAGEIADGFVWGRGALDVKGGVAMLLAALVRTALDGPAPPGDVVLCLVADEEAGGELGARFLVEAHPELFAGVRHAIGEWGGFSLDLLGGRFYPIQVAERQRCWLRATVRGRGGHGALPPPDNPLTRAGRVLARLGAGRLPAHVTPPARATLEAIARALPDDAAATVRALLDTSRVDATLDAAGGALALFEPVLHDTATPTRLRAGEQVNVVPDRVTIDLDGRLLPGRQPEVLLAGVRSLAAEPLELEVLRHDPGPEVLDLSLLPLLGEVVREAEPGAVAVPFLMPGFSDARHFARLGIQTYGFLPMPLGDTLEEVRRIHGVDERIPVGALELGARCLQRVVERYRP
jgi:acetylornithine deacetylase/succinyl-diaminopimelate desuccinylase-like protein